ncbi:MAG: hypothetical protein LBV27_02040 [Oscillospiraceae bacterium]|jgi:hypothetical protein|nr:hypothetical protein [Oscillospiraceae bacterium]
MTELFLGVIEPFGSPVWGSNFVAFASDSGAAVPEEQSKEYISRCCKYAKHYEVYLVPERFMLMGYQCMCLISPEGRVLGAQKNIFWNTASRGNKRSTVLEVLATEFGGVALCVDVDIYHPEVARVASDMGAHIIIGSQYIAKGDYNSSMVVAGIWGAAQSNPVFTVAVTNAFNCVCVPRTMTKHDDGFLVSPNLKIPMTAKLRADDLSALPQRFCLSRRLYAMHRKELL